MHRGEPKEEKRDGACQGYDGQGSANPLQCPRRREPNLAASERAPFRCQGCQEPRPAAVAVPSAAARRTSQHVHSRPAARRLDASSGSGKLRFYSSTSYNSHPAALIRGMGFMILTPTTTTTTSHIYQGPFPDRPPLSPVSFWYFLFPWICCALVVGFPSCFSIPPTTTAHPIPNQEQSHPNPPTLPPAHTSNHARLTTLRVGPRRLRLCRSYLPPGQHGYQHARRRPLHLRLLQPAGNQGAREPVTGRGTEL